MRNKVSSVLLATTLFASVLAGCSGGQQQPAAATKGFPVAASLTGAEARNDERRRQDGRQLLAFFGRQKRRLHQCHDQALQRHPRQN
ncbi:hypothetical protein [Gordoniibacillus kamchatkensis]|uniref:hypothetical protein n=1 Tax=Gordoniibacillus kamchatkensis TaxID=1590651 RepID=UPI001E3708C4|nr:hypothetical protein [Paenibacillus sp. VKM B-2647]